MQRSPIFTCAAFLLLALTAPLCAARLNTEAHYQKIAAEKYGAESFAQISKLSKLPLKRGFN